MLWGGVGWAGTSQGSMRWHGMAWDGGHGVVGHLMGQTGSVPGRALQEPSPQEGIRAAELSKSSLKAKHPHARKTPQLLLPLHARAFFFVSLQMFNILIKVSRFSFLSKSDFGYFSLPAPAAIMAKQCDFFLTLGSFIPPPTPAAHQGCPLGGAHFQQGQPSRSGDIHGATTTEEETPVVARSPLSGGAPGKQRWGAPHHIPPCSTEAAHVGSASRGWTQPCLAQKRGGRRGGQGACSSEKANFCLRVTLGLGFLTAG